MVIKILDRIGGKKAGSACFAALFGYFGVMDEVLLQAGGYNLALWQNADAGWGKLPDLIHQQGIMRTGKQDRIDIAGP